MLLLPAFYEPQVGYQLVLRHAGGQEERNQTVCYELSRPLAARRALTVEHVEVQLTSCFSVSLSIMHMKMLCRRVPHVFFVLCPLLLSLAHCVLASALAAVSHTATELGA